MQEISNGMIDVKWLVDMKGVERDQLMDMIKTRL